MQVFGVELMGLVLHPLWEGAEAGGMAGLGCGEGGGEEQERGAGWWKRGSSRGNVTVEVPRILGI